jgi:hypothetical protein
VDKEDRIYFHSFKENTEEHVWYELGLRREDYKRLVDYTVDSAGNFYILFHHKQPLCEEGRVSISIGKYQRDQGVWQTLESRYTDDCDWSLSYDQIIIDRHNRVWIPVGKAVVVYEEAIWEERVLLKSEYRYYTEGNSGYYGVSDLSVGPDGRIWSLDSSGDALVWIDPDVEELEGTLWPFLGWLYQEWKIRLYIGYGSAIALLAIIIIASLRIRRRRRDVE